MKNRRGTNTEPRGTPAIIYFSAKKFDHLKQPLIDGLLSSFP